jgi:hypothetical protein
VTTLLLGLLLGFSCGGTGSGCAGLTPYPAGTRYVGPKSDNAINFRLSAQGVNYLNSNWQTLIETFAPGRRLTLPVACSRQTTPVGDVIIADTGRAGCNDEDCGLMNGQCETSGARADVGASVQAVITGFALTPRGPDLLDATVQLTIDTGDIPLASVSSSFVGCIGFSRFKCAVRFNTAAANPTDNRLRATVRFSIAQRWDKLLAFQVTTISGTQVCGSSGALAPPQCLQPGDVSLAGRNFCGDIYCGLADLDIVKSTLLELLSPTLQTQIQSLVGEQTCMSCTSTADCPRTTDGTNLQATCQNNICRQGAECVPRFLGVEGTLGLGGLLGSFGAPASAQLELSVAAGSSFTINQGMTFGTRVGVKPSMVSACVPPQAAPPQTAVNAPDFDGEATPGSPYHVGIGISSNFLNETFWAVQQSGGLCLNFSSDNVGLVNTGLFKTFLPSLGKLATRDGKDAPMLVALRPARPPTVTVGEGTYDPMTKRPIKPLLTLSLPDVSVDFYALLDDRYARLFTLTADISLPLSLIFEGCDKVTPALGDIRQLITNIRTANSEMLAEDPQVLADLVPAVIGLAEPALASGLSGFALPTLGSFKLKVNEVKGLGRITGTEAYNHLGLYAQLLAANAMCAVSAPQVVAALKHSRMPSAEAMRLDASRRIPWPEAVLDVRALGKSGSPEFSYRVDRGLWTDFAPAVADELVVTHPRFLLQGRHLIEVRARMAEDPHALSAPVELGFTVDWEPPEVSLRVDRERDRVVVTARDLITESSRLEFAYQVGQGAVSPFGPEREISLSAVELQGGVTVLVRDELGLVGRASWRPAAVAWRPDTPEEATAMPGTGCSSAGGLLALGALALLRRRRR